MTTLAQLRLDLAEAKAQLRDAKDTRETIKAMCEHAAIDSGVAGGKNAEERARSLTVALSYTDEYQGALANLRNCEAAVDRLQAQIAVAEDEIRAAELRVREKLADALMGKPLITAVDDAALARCVSFSRAPVAADAASDTEEWYGR